MSVGCAVFQRVAEPPQLAVDFNLLDLDVGDCRLEVRVPVHQALAPVDEPLVVKILENPENRIVKARVHREAVPRPVAGGSKSLQLVYYRTSGFVLP